jgi:hypothetical protein
MQSLTGYIQHELVYNLRKAYLGEDYAGTRQTGVICIDKASARFHTLLGSHRKQRGSGTGKSNTIIWSDNVDKFVYSITKRRFRVIESGEVVDVYSPKVVRLACMAGEDNVEMGKVVRSG